MTDYKPADFAPVGKRLTLVVEVTDPDVAQEFIALSLGIATDDGGLVAGCKVLDVMQYDARNLIYVMRCRQEKAIELLSGEEYKS